MRKIPAAILVPFMKLSGFRFSKAYRHGISPRHRIIYALVDCIAANHWAGL